MSLTIKFFCFLLILGIAGLFFIKKPDSSSWMSLNDFKPDVSIHSVKAAIENLVPQQAFSGQGSKIQVYRWKNEVGNWQFSDVHPNYAIAEQILVDTSLNRDLAEKTKPRAVEKSALKDGKVILIKNGGISSSSAVFPDKLGQLVDDVKNVQTLMDDRAKQMESVQ